MESRPRTTVATRTIISSIRKFSILFGLFISSLLLPGAAMADVGTGLSATGTLTAMPPDAPIADIPVQTVSHAPDSIIVRWHALDHAASYSLQLSKSDGFSELVIQQAGIKDTLFAMSQLAQLTPYFWRLRAANVAGEGAFSKVQTFTLKGNTSIALEQSSIPHTAGLLPAFPNPCNPQTTIIYHLAETAQVVLEIFNSMGQSVQKLVSETQPAGCYTVSWNGRNGCGAPAPSGIYMCVMKTESQVFVQKLLVTR
jgi:hypothetical protein